MELFPPVGQYGGVAPYGSPLDVIGPAGMGMRLPDYKDAETMRDAMRLLNPEILAAAEARSKKSSNATWLLLVSARILQLAPQ